MFRVAKQPKDRNGQFAKIRKRFEILYTRLPLVIGLLRVQKRVAVEMRRLQCRHVFLTSNRALSNTQSEANLADQYNVQL